MKALYSYSYLNHIDVENLDVPLKRYLFKFINQRKEISKLKHHEKDFLFNALKVSRNKSGNYEHDLFKIPEAKEFLFDRIILMHAKHEMVFDGKIQVPYGELTKKEIRRNSNFFYMYLRLWKELIEKGEGAYLSIIKPEIYKKVKELRLWAKEKRIKKSQQIKKEVYIYAIFFHIYYNVKMFFDEKPKPFIIRKINGYDVTFNIYSYVHILSRHYNPEMNKHIEVSLNSELENVDLEYLPEEIMSLIENWNNQCPITPQTEHLLFSADSEYYILWLKFKRLNETRDMGFEVRSFYKCTKKCDFDMFKLPNQCIINIKGERA